MTRKWLVLRFDAPLMSFGGIAIDQVGPTRSFPSSSMLTGLIGNALGWHWSDVDAHQALQDRLVFGAYLRREGILLNDMQNARLAKTDKGWTTYGEPEGRDGNEKTYRSPHRRFREYLADASVRIVLLLEPENALPSLLDVAAAIEKPVRPLFLGRKPCLPSKPIVAPENERWLEAESAHAALSRAFGGSEARAQWPVGEGTEAKEFFDSVTDLADLKNWRIGLHSGSRPVALGRVASGAEKA